MRRWVDRKGKGKGSKGTQKPKQLDRHGARVSPVAVLGGWVGLGGGWGAAEGAAVGGSTCCTKQKSQQNANKQTQTT